MPLYQVWSLSSLEWDGNINVNIKQVTIWKEKVVVYCNVGYENTDRQTDGIIK
jgi:hypothetical protein